MRFLFNWNSDLMWGGGFRPEVYSAINARHLLLEDTDARADELLDYLYLTADFFLGNLGENKVLISGTDRIGADVVCRQVLGTDQAYDGVPGLIPGIPLYAYNNAGPNADAPDGTRWPKFESNNDQPMPVTRGEFTVNQSILPHAFLYSYLAAVNGDGRGNSLRTRGHGSFPPGADGEMPADANIGTALKNGLTVEVFDIAGRRVRTITGQAHGAFAGMSHRVPNGFYAVRVSNAAGGERVGTYLRCGRGK